MHRVGAAFINSGLLLHCLWSCPLQPVCSPRNTDVCVCSDFFFSFSAVNSARGWLKLKAIKRGKILQKAETCMSLESEGCWHVAQPGPTTQSEPSGGMKQLIHDLLWKETIYLQHVAEGTTPICWIWILNSYSVFNRKLAFKSHCTLDSFIAFCF